MDKRKWLVAILIVGLFFVGSGCIGKGKQTEKKEKMFASVEAVPVSTQGWKTYVSKYGFFVSYPKDMLLNEDEYGLGRGMNHGEVPFSIASVKDSYSIEFSYLKNGLYKYGMLSDLFESGKNVEVVVDDMSIEQQIKKELSGGVAYIFIGSSKQNPGDKIISALIYNNKSKVVLCVDLEPISNEYLFMEVIKNIKIE